MRVLQIGSDRSKRGTLVVGSAAQLRQEAYARAIGYIDDISFTLRTDGAEAVSGEFRSIHPTDSRSRAGYIFDALRIAKKLPRPDIVSAQDPFEAGVAGYFIARRAKVPLHVQVHTDFLSPAYARHSLLNRSRLLLAGFVLKRASHIRVVSERIKKEIETTYHPRALITVLPVFADVGRFKGVQIPPELVTRFAGFKTRLLVVSRLEPEKNVELAIRAFTEAAPEDACLIVVGEGGMRDRLQAISSALHVEARIFFEGGKDPAAYYRMADLVLVPSEYEGYGLVIVEALASGKPVLSTDVGVAREVGAIVSSEQNFAVDLKRWFTSGPRTAELKNSSYKDFEEYVQTYRHDVTASASHENTGPFPKYGPKRTGLAFHSGTPDFLERIYDISFQRMEGGMPLYRDKNGRLFWGGWGSFYTVCLDDEPEQVARDAERIGKECGSIESSFSIPKDIFGARHVNVVVTIPTGMSADQRLDMYERNIRKHIRNTVAASSLRYAAGAPSPEWYPLYRRVFEGHRIQVHPPQLFAALEASFGNDVIVMAAHEGEALVGALYCIRFEKYLLLFSIATDPAYRQERIDSGLYDRAILYAIENGIRYVDFGLTGSKAKSLIAYKLGFGGRPYYIATRTFGTPLRRALDLSIRSLAALKRRVRLS